ncbi:hypothetical protein BpHYR1_043212 [Brachionus plicatilis]|uniref:Uncharacterized protein n=1 Tax=Brachionus plicatilis TaxID=10195 RepID=A0A3M7RRW0_BRAPC|nr:hypothetical protein BpHYR1_043212 [Brachionus plicatilis]
MGDLAPDTGDLVELKPHFGSWWRPNLNQHSSKSLCGMVSVLANSKWLTFESDMNVSSSKFLRLADGGGVAVDNRRLLLPNWPALLQYGPSPHSICLIAAAFLDSLEFDTNFALLWAESDYR